VNRAAEIVLATRNRGKIAELEHLLRAYDPAISVRGLDEFPGIGEIEETGSTFVENARIKAVAVCKATGLIAIADDSGLEVDALGGAPGVYSARYAGLDATDESNNAKLVNALLEVERERRTARFRCAMVAKAPTGAELVAEGAWEGRILPSPRGTMGFGYDPLFLDEQLGLSAAEMAPEVKNGRSHRGKAMARLLEHWPGFWIQAVS
jgi:XTP/dITP diphosphohydrolase